MFNPLMYANSAPAPVPTLDVTGPAAAQLPFVPLRRTDLAGAVLGPLADLTLTHTFQFGREVCPQVVAACHPSVSLRPQPARRR